MAPTLRKRKLTSESTEEEEICSKRTKNELESTPLSWFDIPLEMREMVIEKMDRKTRCRFVECAKQCEEEIKVSRSYIYGMNVFRCSSDIYITFKFDKYSGYSEFGYKFTDYGTGKTKICYMICKYPEKESIIVSEERYFAINGEEKWMIIEDGELKDVALKYLKHYLDIYKNCIREFIFDSDAISIKDYNLKSLRRLESFEVDPKCSSYFLETGFLDINQILKIRDFAGFYTKFTFEQVCNFRGEVLHMKCDEFDDKTIKKYLEMWSNGELIGNNIKFIQVNTPENRNLNMDFYTKNLNEDDKWKGYVRSECFHFKSVYRDEVVRFYLRSNCFCIIALGI